jgi:hypothetical protein
VGWQNLTIISAVNIWGEISQLLLLCNTFGN